MAHSYIQRTVYRAVCRMACKCCCMAQVVRWLHWIRRFWVRTHLCSLTFEFKICQWLEHGINPPQCRKRDWGNGNQIQLSWFSVVLALYIQILGNAYQTFYELAQFDVFWKLFSKIPRTISFSLGLTLRSHFPLFFFFDWESIAITLLLILTNNVIQLIL